MFNNCKKFKIVVDDSNTIIIENLKNIKILMNIYKSIREFLDAIDKKIEIIKSK